MAALDRIYHPTATVTSVHSEVEPARFTNPQIPLVPSTRRDVPSSSLHWRSNGLRTVPDVDPGERGNEHEEERNEANAEKADGDRSPAVLPTTDDEVGSRLRSELARDLIHRVNQIMPLIGDISLAANLRLLNRDLSRCHDALTDHPSEENFLSIVTLVESAMAPLKWKQYTNLQLDVFRQVLDIGYRQVRVDFDSYEKARTLFASAKVDATPCIDLATMQREDLTDDEEN